jgi:drug/metabolite transporter (DMT)-like permease
VQLVRLRVVKRTPWLAYVLLGVACLAFGAGSALQKKIDVSSDILKLCWRMQVSLVLLLPFMAITLYRDPESRRRLCTLRYQAEIVLLSFCQSVWIGVFFIAIHNTSILHALLFSSMHSFLMVIFNFCLCRPTARGEVAGVLLGIGGSLIMLLGPSVPGQVSVLWDMITLGSCVFGICYVLLCDRVRPNVPLALFMPEVMLLASVVAALVTYFKEGTPLWSSATSETIFGWVQPDRLLLVCLGAFLSGIVGTIGYAACLKYMPAVVVTVAMLLEPVTGDVFGVLLHVEAIPSWSTALGSVVLMVASLLIIATESMKSKVQENDVSAFVTTVEKPEARD